MAVPRFSALLMCRKLVGSSLGVHGAAARTLATSAQRNADRYFTKKHEWVLVDGAKGEDIQQS